MTLDTQPQFQVTVTAFVYSPGSGGYQPGISVQIGNDQPRRTVYNVTFDTEALALSLARDIARTERNLIQRGMQAAIDSLRAWLNNPAYP